MFVSCRCTRQKITEFHDDFCTVLFQLTETETEIAKKLKNNHQLTETETETEITNKTETEKYISGN